MENLTDESEVSWPRDTRDVLLAGGIRLMSYVPDAGHAALIRLLSREESVRCIPLTSEEEGVPLACGAWLGGQRSVMLMQSSGVGNCINAFSLLDSCRFPFLALVTMRGEWAEFNPWQVPMGSKTPACLELMGFNVFRVDDPEAVAPTVDAALAMAFDSDQRIAILLSQKLIGRKIWTRASGGDHGQ